MSFYATENLQSRFTGSHSMDTKDLRWLQGRDYYDFWENEDRRDDFEEPWNWAFPTVLEDLGDYEEPWDDIRRRERMAEAIYDC